MTIEIGGTPFVFCAAHAGLHDGEFEPLHGHTFAVTLRLSGNLDRRASSAHRSHAAYHARRHAAAKAANHYSTGALASR
jgi:hypothetical protein